MSVSQQLREHVRERSKHRCEYCQTQERIVIYLEVEHIVPGSKGGDDALDNLAYTCRLCNSYKHDHQTGNDPETGREEVLYHPRQMVWDEHFQWSRDGILLLGLTPIGRATIERLQINRDLHVLSRQLWVAAGWHPPQDNQLK